MQTAGIQKGRPEDVAWAEAFIQVVRYCAENDEQITITDLCEKLKEYLNGDTPYTEKYRRENEARETFPGGRHPYWYPGETECCYILVNCRKDLGTVFKICQGKRRGENEAYI